MNAQPNDGRLAFPQPMAALPTTGEMYCAFEKHPDFGGMTLRDYFAAAALQGMMASESTKIMSMAELVGNTGVGTAELAAETAYIHADAMLAARDGGGSV